MIKDTEDFYWMIRAMEVYGGGFINSLANCFQHANSDNTQRLLNAFPDYVKQYAEMGKKMREKEPNNY